MTITSEGQTTHNLAASPEHPLTSLTEEEISAVRDIVVSLDFFSESTRFVYMGLEEPHKQEVLAWQAGEGAKPDRQVRVMLLDLASGHSTDSIISLGNGTVLRTDVIDGSVGHLPTIDTEYDIVSDVLMADAGWIEALDRRGVPVDQVKVVPLSAGFYGYPEEEGKRIMRAFAFRQDYEGDHIWAHPIDGLVGHVDTVGRTVTKIIDTGAVPIPVENGNYDDPEVQGPQLTELKPIVITQPEGASYTVDGEHVTWGNWKLQVGFDMREGLVLRNLTYRYDGEDRPILYRASISEMVVPYADPQPTRGWQNYFDTGEYVYGRYTNSLSLGCDCVGEIRYFDAVFADELGVPRVIRNGICMHEEDTGTLWKHSDLFTGANEVRRGRRLVISFFTTVGNYDYGFFWYLYLDGTIECEAKLTGVLFTSAYPGLDADGNDYAYASEVAPGLGAPYHQHLFNARLDMMVDGLANSV
ncbi:MAG: tyramine oxidase, partial [Microbacterium chocolatum]|nr:tyramine oxidase [Microbacterium chocolatum]